MPGAAAPILLIHGVGFGPETMAPVARWLELRHEVLVVSRRGYGDRRGAPACATVTEQAAEVLTQAQQRFGAVKPVVAGVSGGATVALAAALAWPERIALAVAHEPAAGRLAPELRALIGAALDRGGGLELARLLAGDRTWGRLAPDYRSALSAAAPVIEADAAAFIEFEPLARAARPKAPLVLSVGDRSPPLRHAVARRLAGLTGAPVTRLPRSGHLAQLDAPIAFAQLISQHAPAERSAGSRPKEPSR